MEYKQWNFATCMLSQLMDGKNVGSPPYRENKNGNMVVYRLTNSNRSDFLVAAFQAFFFLIVFCKSFDCQLKIVRATCYTSHVT